MNNEVSNSVSKGLPAGTYRMASITTAANHQPVLGPVAQHGSFDDMIYVSSKLSCHALTVSKLLHSSLSTRTAKHLLGATTATTPVMVRTTATTVRTTATTATTAMVPRVRTTAVLPTLQRMERLPTLRRMESLPTLRRMDSLPTLRRMDSLPTLRRMESLPTLPRMDSLPTLLRTTMVPVPVPPKTLNITGRTTRTTRATRNKGTTVAGSGYVSPSLLV